MLSVEVVESGSPIGVRFHRTYVGIKTSSKKFPEIRPFCRRIGAIGLLEGFQRVGDFLDGVGMGDGAEDKEKDAIPVNAALKKQKVLHEKSLRYTMCP